MSVEQMRKTKLVSKSVLTWSEVLSNRVSVIIRRFTDHFKFAASFIFFWFYFVSLFTYGCMFRTLLNNFVYRALLLSYSCILIVMYVPF